MFRVAGPAALRAPLPAGGAMSDSGTQLMTGLQLEDAIEILERRRWWILLAALCGLVLGFIAYLVLPARYESSTTILVEPQGVPESFVKSTVTLEVEQRLYTLQERVTSYQSLNELIDRVGTQTLDPTGQLTREAIMGEIRRNLGVEISPRKASAPVFALTYGARDPELAALVVREIAGLFMQENLKDRARQATATAEFLDNELERLRTEVSQQEEKIRNFQFGSMGSLPSQLDANLRELDRLNLELASNLEAQVETTQRSALLRRQFGGAEAANGQVVEVPGSLHALLRSAQQELLHARQTYTEEHPNVRHLHDQVENLKREIAEGPRQVEPGTGTFSDPTLDGLNKQVGEAGLQLDAHKRQENRIRARIEELEQRVAQTPSTEQDLQALTRDYENLSTTYRQLLGKKQEAALARNLELAQKGERFRILLPAQVPNAPIWPDLAMTLPAGLAFGLALVALGIGIAEFRNPAFRSVERLTRVLGLPVFASIPRIDNDQIYEVKPGDDVDPKLVAFTAPESSPAEQYRGFLPTYLEAEHNKVLLVTSAARGDGKTLTTMNLAVTLATDLNKRVLVIDGDLRRPRVHKVMRTDRKKGLSTILTKQATLDECTVQTKVPNLTVLPSGRSVRNPLTLLTDRAFLEVIEQAKSRFDIVVIDSPPLLPVVDSKILRKMADMVLFVVRADSTPRDAVIRSMRDMKGVAGVIFNQVSPGSFRRYYYYDAYSTYAYGEPIEQDEAEEVRAVV
jgi:polysaccharide chain length determinant protein (PEP-CTERM system associated)